MQSRHFRDGSLMEVLSCSIFASTLGQNDRVLCLCTVRVEITFCLFQANRCRGSLAVEAANGEHWSHF